MKVLDSLELGAIVYGCAPFVLAALVLVLGVAWMLRR